MAMNSSDVGLIAFQKFLEVLRTGHVKSLAEYTQNFRAEPFVLVDSECVFLEEMFDVMQSLQSQYAAYYLLAMSAMTTIGNVQVAQHMSKLNPSRSTLDAAVGTATAGGGLLIARESFTDHLPTVRRMLGTSNSPRGVENEGDTLIAGVGRDAVKEIRELSNLAVGKIISAEIVDGKTKVTVPLAIRLIATSLTSESVVHNLTGGMAETGFWERLSRYKAGLLTLNDMLFCSDLVKAKRKALLDDEEGLVRNILGRQNSNKLAGLLSLNPSVGTYSNMAVITETTARQLEIAMAGKSLKDFKAREKLFDNTAMLILAVVDRQWKRVTFYHQSIARPLETSFRDLKASNKGSGPDVADILNAYRLGTTPTL